MFRRLILLTVAGFSVAVSQNQQAYIKNYALLFMQWMENHGFNFTEHEFLHRLENFIQNDKFIDESNSHNYTYTLGHNKFSHMNSEEFASSMLCGGMKDTSVKNLRGFLSEHNYVQDDINGLPSSVDWRKHNAVTDVKNQGNCGSCWSFSTTGGLEGIYAISTGQLVSFSEQQLVDCDNVDSGCNGGLMTNAFEWIEKNNGLCTEENYPYVSGNTGKAGKCQNTCTLVVKSGISGYAEVKENDKNALMTALAKQPVSVAIQANQPTFQLYKSGVLTGKCGDRLDHGVLAVGYDSSAQEPYWIVKNSWGNTWGEGGYINLAMNVDQSSGQCGILSMASYPKI